MALSAMSQSQKPSLDSYLVQSKCFVFEAELLCCPISFLPQCTCFHFKRGLMIFMLEIIEKSC